MVFFADQQWSSRRIEKPDSGDQVCGKTPSQL
jgi:hypothetical protein